MSALPVCAVFFFFKQKTAYEMRISDWSSDVCSSDLLDTLLPTLPVHARALAAWRLEDQWVTAVRLTNTSARWLDLDPRALQGNFVAATFQHPNLGPAGTPSDTTVLYLVTRGHGLAASPLPDRKSVV